VEDYFGRHDCDFAFLSWRNLTALFCDCREGSVGGEMSSSVRRKCGSVLQSLVSLSLRTIECGRWYQMAALNL
jgi:hypothetical protein